MDVQYNKNIQAEMFRRAAVVQTNRNQLMQTLTNSVRFMKKNKLIVKLFILICGITSIILPSFIIIILIRKEKIEKIDVPNFIPKTIIKILCKTDIIKDTVCTETPPPIQLNGCDEDCLAQQLEGGPDSISTGGSQDNQDITGTGTGTVDPSICKSLGAHHLWTDDSHPLPSPLPFPVPEIDDFREHPSSAAEAKESGILWKYALLTIGASNIDEEFDYRNNSLRFIINGKTYHWYGDNDGGSGPVHRWKGNIPGNIIDEQNVLSANEIANLEAARGGITIPGYSDNHSEWILMKDDDYLDRGNIVNSWDKDRGEGAGVPQPHSNKLRSYYWLNFHIILSVYSSLLTMDNVQGSSCTCTEENIKKDPTVIDECNLYERNGTEGCAPAYFIEQTLHKLKNKELNVNGLDPSNSQEWHRYEFGKKDVSYWDIVEENSADWNHIFTSSSTDRSDKYGPLTKKIIDLMSEGPAGDANNATGAGRRGASGEKKVWGTRSCVEANAWNPPPTDCDPCPPEEKEARCSAGTAPAGAGAANLISLTSTSDRTAREAEIEYFKAQIAEEDRKILANRYYNTEGQHHLTVRVPYETDQTGKIARNCGIITPYLPLKKAHLESGNEEGPHADAPLWQESNRCPAGHDPNINEFTPDVVPLRDRGSNCEGMAYGCDMATGDGTAAKYRCEWGGCGEPLEERTDASSLPAWQQRSMDWINGDKDGDGGPNCGSLGRRIGECRNVILPGLRASDRRAGKAHR